MAPSTNASTKPRADHEPVLAALKAAKWLCDNINEFGQCNDGEGFDRAETAIRAAILKTQPGTSPMSEQSKDGWQDIASAPRDGTRVLLARIVGHPDHPTALWWAVTGHWSDKWKNWNDGLEPSGLADPTHFMFVTAKGVFGSLPTPPAKGD